MLKGCVVAVGVLTWMLAAAECRAQDPGYQGDSLLEDPLNLEGYRVWARLEYLLWHLQAAPLPSALVTTGGPVNEGVVGAADTVVLYGGSQDYGWQSGGRVAAGLWFDAGDRIGVEASFFLLASKSEYFSDTAPAGAVLSLPVSTVVNNVATPNVFALASSAPGSVYIENSVRFLGGNLDFVCVPYRNNFFEFNLLGGFAAVYLKESYAQSAAYSSTSSSSVSSGPTVTNTTTTVNTQAQDSFGTLNNFYGGEFGARGILRLQPFFLELTGKLAIGDNIQIVDIAGLTTNNSNSTSVATTGLVSTTTTSSSTTTNAAGILAQASNSGNFRQNAVCLLPWGQIRAGVDVTANIQFSVGYDILMLSSVVRPGNQIDQVMGTLNGVNHPAFAFSTSSFLVQGFNVGLAFRY